MKKVVAFALVILCKPVVADTAMVLHFEEREAGVEPYPLRLLITKDYVRVDEGMDAGGYVLYDRKQKRIHNILDESEQVLTVEPAESEALAIPDIKLSYQSFSVNDAPQIAEQSPQGFHLMADGEKCAHAIVVQGLLPAASMAMVEFQQLLGKQSEATLKNTPASFQTPCFLAENILQPGWNWHLGLPVHTWDNKGYRSELVDYRENEEVSSHLFELPTGYREQPLLME